MCSQHDVLPCHRPKATGSSGHGLKPWAKINLTSFYLRSFVTAMESQLVVGVKGIWTPYTLGDASCFVDLNSSFKGPLLFYIHSLVTFSPHWAGESPVLLAYWLCSHHFILKTSLSFCGCLSPFCLLEKNTTDLWLINNINVLLTGGWEIQD
jgi:hypothetical protein